MFIRLTSARYGACWLRHHGTDFTNACSRLWKQKDADGRTAKSWKLINHTLDLITVWQDFDNLKMWCLENPPGRLHSLGMGKPKAYFHPHEYAGYLPEDRQNDKSVFVSNRYRKKTCLWGDFSIPEKKPLPYLDNLVKGQTAISLLPPSADRPNIRAKTPEGFALAFYLANKDR